ncbi:MAG: T9SS type A sorting domain-containing protein [Bacteroidetes bacterium]|nr:T9SS type A sorting domain-containing protein [Bacteroidota bacterium]
MKKFFLTSAFSLFIFYFLPAQTTTTFRISYNYAAFDLPGNTIQAPNKDYVLGGTNLTFGGTGSILRLDTVGAIKWAKIYSPIWGINDVKNVTGGEYIVSGSVATGGNAGLALMRFNSSGGVVWGKSFKTSAFNGSSEAGSRVIETSDGGFLSAGYTYDIDPDGGGALPIFDSANYFIVKTNGAGVLSWAKVILPTTVYINDHVLNDVAEVSDGYIFVGNMSENGVVGDDNTDAIILKTDFSGNFLWMNKYGASGSSQSFNSAVTLGSGEVLICGTNDTRTTYLRINSVGTIASGYRYGSAFLPALDGWRIFPTADGNYAMMGMYFSFSFNSFILKINPANGAIIWGKRYPAFGGLFPEGQQTADGGYVMNMMSGTVSWDYLVLKTDPTGLIPSSGCIAPTIYNPAVSAHGLSATAVTPTFLTVSNENALAITPLNIAPTRSVECSYIMPVEMLSFEGKSKNDGVELTWSTASEKNNDYFAIERSVNAEEWEEAGKISGAGNSSTVQNYEFVDAEISSQYSMLNTQYYYRLKQTDYDGSYEYSKIISVKLSPADDWKLILNNFSEDELKGKLLVSEKANVAIDIMDMQGRIIQREKLNAQKGVNLLDVNIARLDQGLYFIKAYNSDKNILSKFVKK